MLHKDERIVDPATFLLTQKLLAIPELSGFVLVGGTALALQMGHRNSIDIDLFSRQDFSTEKLIKSIKDFYPVEVTLERKNTILSIINKIKVDFIKHDYHFIKPPIEEEGIRMLSMEDIAAMKFHAIIQSGKRLKDFIDIYFLLEHLSMEAMMGFFVAKYSYSNPMIAMKAVNYFGDIDESIDPPQLIKPVPLKKIMERIQEATLHPKKVFGK
jgi:hypothetical protein